MAVALMISLLSYLVIVLVSLGRELPLDLWALGFRHRGDMKNHIATPGGVVYTALGMTFWTSPLWGLLAYVATHWAGWDIRLSSVAGAVFYLNTARLMAMRRLGS